MTGLTYDPNGNIEKLVRKDETGAKVDSLTYNYTSGKNQLQTLIEDAGQTPVDWDVEDTDFTYDSNGNVKTVKEDGSYKFKSIQYDSRNLPIFVEKGDGSEIIYLYSADGQRIYKKVDNNTGEHYIMDGSLNVGVFTEDGSLKHWNMLADGVAGRVESDASKKYYLTDHLGSTRTVIDENGLVVESHDYYPFGLQMPGRDFLAVSVRTKELFTGKELDDETGLHYYGGRYYWAPGVRWWSVDPLAEKYPSLSPYTYVANNPLKYVDPDGKAISVAIGGGIVLGAGELTVLALGSVAALAATVDLEGTAEALRWVSSFVDENVNKPIIEGAKGVFDRLQNVLSEDNTKEGELETPVRVKWPDGSEDRIKKDTNPDKRFKNQRQKKRQKPETRQPDKKVPDKGQDGEKTSGKWWIEIPRAIFELFGGAK